MRKYLGTWGPAFWLSFFHSCRLSAVVVAKFHSATAPLQYSLYGNSVESQELNVSKLPFEHVECITPIMLSLLRQSVDICELREHRTHQWQLSFPTGKGIFEDSRNFPLGIYGKYQKFESKL